MILDFGRGGSAKPPFSMVIWSVFMEGIKRKSVFVKQISVLWLGVGLVRREVAPKTSLAGRLRAVRRHLGDPDRDEIAAKIGVSKSTLASYERGESEPSASALAAYRDFFDVNVSWLLFDEGEMFLEKESRAPKDTVDIVLLQKLGDVVQTTFMEVKQTPPSRAITMEAGQLYNELLAMVTDIRDDEVVEAMIPVLRSRLKTRLLQAASEPGTGKRSAS